MVAPYLPPRSSAGNKSNGYKTAPASSAGPRSGKKKEAAFVGTSAGNHDLTNKMGSLNLKQTNQKVGTALPTSDFARQSASTPATNKAGRGNQYNRSSQRTPSAQQSQVSRVTRSMLSAVRQRGVHVQGVLTNITSTSVANFQPRNSRMRANTDARLYGLGQIIVAPWVVSSLDCKALKAEDPASFNSFAWAETTGPICAKMRPMIVYAIFSDHLLVYPIFSSQGNGLFYKDREICDRSLPLYQNTATVDLKDGLYYLRADANWGNKESSYVDMTMPYNVSLSAPIAIQARLTHHSWARFIGMHTAYLKRGQKPVGEYHPLPGIPAVDTLGRPLRSPT